MESKKISDTDLMRQFFVSLAAATPIGVHALITRREDTIYFGAPFGVIGLIFSLIIVFLISTPFFIEWIENLKPTRLYFLKCALSGLVFAFLVSVVMAILGFVFLCFADIKSVPLNPVVWLGSIVVYEVLIIAFVPLHIFLGGMAIGLVNGLSIQVARRR